MRVETLTPEIKVRYEHGVEKADWLLIHCEIVQQGITLAYQYEFNFPDDVEAYEEFTEPKAYKNWHVTPKWAYWEPSFPSVILEQVVKETLTHFVSDLAEYSRTHSLKDCELWIVVAPDGIED